MASAITTTIAPGAHTIAPTTPNMSVPEGIQRLPSSASHQLESFEIIDPSPPTATSDEEHYPTGAKFWLTILTLGAALVLGGLDNNIVATAVPSITNHFHTVADVGWYSSAYRLCTCSFQFMFGKLYKLFPVKTVFLAANAIFLLGSLLCAQATTSTMFVVGRAVNGLGFAGVAAGCFTVLVQIMPLRRRPMFAGLLSCVESVALIGAPIIGGLLTNSLGWRWCFYINLPIGVATLLATALLFSNPHREAGPHRTKTQILKELDLVSNLLFIPGLTCLFVALSWAGTKYAWDDPKVISLLVIFVVLVAAFAYNQSRRGDSAALPFRIINHRSVVAGAIYSMFTNGAMNVLQYYLPTYYQVVRGYDPASSGYLMVPMLIGDMLGLFLQGMGTTVIGYYAPFMILGSVAMPIAAGLMTTYKVDTTFVQLILYSGFAGFAGGIGFQSPQSAVQTALSTADAPLGLAVIFFAQNFGPALFISIAQVIFTNQLSSNLSGIVPGLTAANLENRGLTEIKTGIPMAKLPEVLVGVDKSLIQTWYLVIALSCMTLVGSLLTEWRSVKHKTN